MVRFPLVFAFAAVSLIGLSSAVNSIPPLFREYPNARTIEAPLEDAEVNYRLPNNTIPIHYDVELTTNVHKGETAFSGKVTIEVNVLEDTRTIVIHSRRLTITSATIQKDETSFVLTHSYEEEREFLSLTPESTTVNLLRGETWKITIEYNGDLRRDNGGFYLSSYKDENNNEHFLATTQFESTDARHGFPCYDEPSKRATFTITINHDPSYHAISNMDVDSAKSTSGHTVFEKTVIMPTYLIAFIVSDFKFTKGELNSLPQRVFSRSGTEHDQEWALVSGMLLVQRLAEYYKINFALPKLDQVAVPDFAAGAMENWGLVTYREEYLLYNKDRSTVNTQTNIANIIAHEYTHQWFGNLVAVKWWTYLWLKEGFATLFSYHATDEAYPEWGIYQMFHTDEYQRALNSDADMGSRPMTHYIQTPREISRLYDSISYSKAGSVLSMWQHALTDVVFRQGLHNYLTQNQFSAAEENDLFEAIQTAAKEENVAVVAKIQDMMSSWTRHGGYPVLTVKRNYNDGTFTIEQTPFYNNASLQGNHLWYVPINVAMQSNPDFRDTKATHYLLQTKDLHVTDVKIPKDDWLILNKQSTGYYRINYDEENWNLITHGLIHKPYQIHPRNRAQLMHDAYRFSVSNRLKHGILLDLLTYLDKEDQYAPWSTANGILTTFNRYLSGDSEYGVFKNYVANLVENLYEKLGVNDVPGEQHFQKYIRSITINLACMAGIESCLQETNKKLKDFIEQNIEIEPNLQAPIYCNGLKQASDAEFDFVYNKLMKSDDQALNRILISSLGCSQKESQIKKFIESSIDESNDLRVQERTTLLSPAYSRGEVGLYACINFLKENWQKYGGMTSGTFGGSNPLDSDIRGMSSYVVNKDQEKSLLELVELVKGSEYVTSNLEQSVKSNINANFEWLNNNRNPIVSWLAEFFKVDTGGSGAIHASSIGIALVVLLTRLF